MIFKSRRPGDKGRKLDYGINKVSLDNKTLLFSESAGNNMCEMCNPAHPSTKRNNSADKLTLRQQKSELDVEPSKLQMLKQAIITLADSVQVEMSDIRNQIKANSMTNEQTLNKFQKQIELSQETDVLRY